MDAVKDHRMLLYIALAFFAINICLIIATGGIIFNWQDRFVGPVLKCNQPKWNSEGRSERMMSGYWGWTGDGYVRNGDWWNNNAWTNWNNNGNNNVNVNVNANSNGNVNANVNANWNGNNNGNVNWNNNNNVNRDMHSYDNREMIESMVAFSENTKNQYLISAQSWTSARGGAWSTCPVLSFPRWSELNRQPVVQNWNTWTQPAATWNTWVDQPTATWNTWTQPIAAWTQPIAAWTQPVASQPTGGWVWVAGPPVSSWN